MSEKFKTGYEDELADTNSVSSNDDQGEIHESVVDDHDLEQFLGDMENELEDLIQQSKREVTVPSIPFEEWYSSYSSKSRSYSGDGWTLYTSPEGYPYYYNSRTGESEWAPSEDAVNFEGEADGSSGTNMLGSLEGVSPSPAKSPIATIKGVSTDTSTRIRAFTDSFLGDTFSPAVSNTDNSLPKTASGTTKDESIHVTSGGLVSLFNTAKIGIMSLASGSSRSTLEQIARSSDPPAHDDESNASFDEDTKTKEKDSIKKEEKSRSLSDYGMSLYSVASSSAAALINRAAMHRQTGLNTEALRRATYDELKAQPGSVEITIPARSCSKIPFVVSKGKEILWRMQVKDYDIGFAVRLRQQGEGGGVESDLLPLERISCEERVSEGCCAENVTRSFIFVFDNSYSNFRSKTCIYHISLVDDTECNMREEPLLDNESNPVVEFELDCSGDGVYEHEGAKEIVAAKIGDDKKKSVAEVESVAGESEEAQCGESQVCTKHKEFKHGDEPKHDSTGEQDCVDALVSDSNIAHTTGDMKPEDEVSQATGNERTDQSYLLQECGGRNGENNGLDTSSKEKVESTSTVDCKLSEFVEDKCTEVELVQCGDASDDECGSDTGHSRLEGEDYSSVDVQPLGSMVRNTSDFHCDKETSDIDFHNDIKVDEYVDHSMVPAVDEDETK